MLASHHRHSLAFFALAASVVCGLGCATPSQTGRPGRCDAGALVATWERPADRLVMDLVADNCAIRGTADNPAFRHTIEGTYDPEARTAIGTIRRTNVASGCVTVMRTTWMLTDPRHLNMAIVGTDGACDLPAGYNEISTLIRQCDCGKR
jgi:hypothetical protein